MLASKEEVRSAFRSRISSVLLLAAVNTKLRECETQGRQEEQTARPLQATARCCTWGRMVLQFATSQGLCTNGSSGVTTLPTQAAH
jgi:hypothetical protein